MDMKGYLLLILPLIAAALSSYLTYLFGIKSKRKESMLRFKEEKYSNLLVLMYGFIGHTANSETKRLFF